MCSRVQKVHVEMMSHVLVFIPSFLKAVSKKYGYTSTSTDPNSLQVYLKMLLLML